MLARQTDASCAGSRQTDTGCYSEPKTEDFASDSVSIGFASFEGVEYGRYIQA